MAKVTLPGIRKIEIIRCHNLPARAMLHSICGCLVAIAAPSEAVDFIGRPLLTVEGSTVNGVPQEKTTLEFITSSPLPEGENLAFVVTGVDGQQLLLGTREDRFPVISYTRSTGNPGGEAAVRRYKVTHVAQKTPLACVL